MSTLLIVFMAQAQSQEVYDNFQIRNTSIWSYADHKLSHVEDGLTYYLSTQGEVGADLSNGQTGLRITIEPCKNATLCHGALMVSEHVESLHDAVYGDYELMFRAPYEPTNMTHPQCADEIYSYFTAGYSDENNVWNEMNFGLRNDPRGHGEASHVVSCECHGDNTGYKENYVDLGYNFRDGFHLYKISHRPGEVKWSVDDKTVYKLDINITHAMHTSLIVRSNSQNETMPKAVAEYEYFRYTPYTP
eukprot:m.9603 g.9603  ORF g.9603 m.9603 type:complete len:247 (+) comp4097_c0_seq1:78-818(+)